MIYVATYVTNADLDDLRDSVRDADLEFLASFPCSVARTRDDALAAAMSELRVEYDVLNDPDDQSLPCIIPSDIMPEMIEPAPAACATVHNVYLCADHYALISIRVFDI